MGKRANETEFEALDEVDYEDEDTDDGDDSTAGTDNRSSEQTGSSDMDRFVANLMSDPEINAILQARRTGKKVKIIEEEENPSGGEEEESLVDDPAFADLDDDTKRVVQVMEKRLSGALRPIMDKVGSLEQIAVSYEQQAIDRQIAETQKKHPDMKKYIKDMAKLSREEGAGLKAEELYLLAKHRAGKLDLVSPSTDTERPTATPRQRRPGDTMRGKKTGTNANPRGRKGFQVTLADALENLDLSARE